MKKFSVNSRKVRYGGVTVALTALIIAVVVMLNVIFSMLSQRFLWYIDMTPELLYTISDECIDLIRNGDDEFDTESPIEMVDKIRAENKAYNAANSLTAESKDYRNENVSINIIFCDDIDVIQSNAMQRYVYNSALELQKEFPDYINITNYNVIKNPSAVSKYKTTTNTSIPSSSVIIEFGSEFRVYGITNFYTYDSSSSSSEPWAYDIEKKFAAAILAVTRADSPLACITNNHGESFLDYGLVNTLVDAGYQIEQLDLSTGDIPEDCRLIVIYNPKSDFLIKDGVSDIDEINKLDAFLDGTNSMMVFMSPDSPVLPNLETYLEEWGISFDRYTDDAGSKYPYMVKDSSQSLTTDGFTIISEYASTAGPVSSVTKDMRSVPYPKNVIFSNAMSISYSEVFEPSHYTDTSDSANSFDYGHYYSNGVERSIYDLFVTSPNAEAHAAGMVVEKATEANPLRLMTLSVETRNTQESNYSVISEASYVLACGSTSFATDSLLQSSSYGNTDLLLSVCRIIGREPVPVGLIPKPFADYDIDNITTAQTTQYTVVLTVVPAVAAIVAGAVVLIRRKNK
ncbi:MAG: Gldg family protein [Clostridia bacterium]|nr:Gldg family protein [Clostridia bacterium]